jgi:hypothetical protein
MVGVFAAVAWVFQVDGGMGPAALVMMGALGVPPPVTFVGLAALAMFKATGMPEALVTRLANP